MKRDLSIDTLKGFLILLVILGHLIGSLKFSWPGVWNLIYTFHMPLFVLISGYLSKRDDTSVFTILKPLLVFQVLNIIILVILGHPFSFTYFLIPHWTLWYLLSLIFWRLILKYTPSKLINKPYIYLGITLLTAVVVGLFLPYGRVLSIQRTISFLPFFLMGYYFRIGKIQQKIWSNTIAIALLVIVSLVCVLEYYPANASVLLRGADNYTMHDLPNKIFILGCSIICVFSIWNLKREVSWLAQIGKHSLFYYLYHGIIIEFLIVPIVEYYNIPANLPNIIIYFLLIIFMIHFAMNISVFKWLVNPSLTTNK